MADDREDVYSKAVRAGKRTYFFDVKSTRGRDLFLTITESKKHTHEDGSASYEKHKIFLYKEDFNRFLASLQEVIDHVKVDLMPNYDYEEFDRKQAEWEANSQNEAAGQNNSSEPTDGEEIAW